MSKLEFHRNGKVMHDKVIIGQIDKTDDGWHVSDHGSTNNRVVRKNTELRQRFALT